MPDQDFESNVARHYGDGGLLGRILAGLEASGVDPERIHIDDLAPVDEFHIGGRQATVHALNKLALKSSDHVLDIGCGIGGAARYIATTHDCNMSAIDLTPDYIEAAKDLTARTGLGDKICFQTASALALPFADDTFDAAITFHVAMNIPDRSGMYGEAARVLKPGGKLCIYDVMKKSGEAISFPVPWAETAATSHLTSVDEMRALLGRSGFEIIDVDDRTQPAIDFFKKRLADAAGAKGPPPPLGIHLILGASAVEKFTNTLANIEAGKISPVEIIAQRKG